MSTRPNRKPLSPFARITKWVNDGRIVEDGECWLWTGTKTPGGYAQAAMSAKTRGDYTPGAKVVHVVVHRWTYELHVGPIPAGLDLDHLCRVRNCVNPWHLEPVTRSVNLKRAVGIGSQWSKRTHCSAGHEYTPENMTRATDGSRVCRTCRREISARYAARQRERYVEREDVA